MNDRPLVRKLNAQKLIHVEEFHEGKRQKKRVKKVETSITKE